MNPTLFAPAIAATVALLVHCLLPDQQTWPRGWLDTLPAWQHPYPLALGVLLVLSLALPVIAVMWLPSMPWLCHHAPLIAGAIGVGCVWDLLTQKSNWLQFPYFPGPELVLGSLVEDAGFLALSAGNSLLLLVSGYAVGVTAGVATGVAIGWFARARYWGMPVLKLVGPLPATALVPLVFMLSSGSFLPATALIGYAVWFPVTMLTASGIASVRISYLDVARTLGAGPAYLILNVALPAALPHIFLGMFMGLGAAFLTLPAAELVGVSAGLGPYVKLQQGNMDYAKMYGALLIMIVFFAGLMTLLFKVRDRILSWQKGIIQW